MLRCASGPIASAFLLRPVELVSRVQRRPRRFHSVGIRKAKGIYHHRFRLPGFAVMSVFKLQQRNKRVFVQNIELVGQFLERHASASFRCARSSMLIETVARKSGGKLSSTASIEFRSLNQFRARSQKEGPKRESFPPIPLPGHLRAELSFAILLRRSLRSCLVGLASLVSCGTWLAYFPVPNRAAICAIFSEGLDKQRTWVHV